ncbi:hypothetical protein ANCCAN_09741 [Ancylostoma caninum]|uniref:Uncharacterized protein n=1 Tax=Ancylostoma caninum TaxID=29170 RepID=A0A368GLZ6_ANCCA|nr:hypothetical protein ANCCAN_09741 [Ancylostoma caninum]
MNFEKHVTRDNLLIDMKTNYPAMFLSPEQYAEMLVSIPGEVNAPAIDSKEWFEARSKEEKSRR